MSVAHQRRLVADLFRLLGGPGRPGDASPAFAAPPPAHAAPPPAHAAPEPSVPLSPPVRQTLDRLLLGDSEKQVAQPWA